jgi:Fe2+ or Zn2+ uptake regulation protein
MRTIVADPKIKREKRAKNVMRNIKKNENIEKLKEAGLKVTHSRCKILELFQNSPDEHYTC